MQRTLYSIGSKMRPRVKARIMAAFMVVAFASSAAFAGTPDWLKHAAQVQLPAYADDVDAVVLLDETTTNVSQSGEVHTVHRKALRILRPDGRNRGTVHVYFDNDTRLTYLKAWSINAAGAEFEVKEGEAVETAAFSEALYGDTRYKSLRIPAAEKGSVIGYEYQQRERQSVQQKLWMFQDEIPVKR